MSRGHLLIIMLKARMSCTNHEKGLGLVMAKALAANGASKVYILGRRLEALESAAKEHPSLVAIQCDVTSKDDLQAAVDKITADVGFINILVANSGMTGPYNTWDPSRSIQEVRKSLFTDNSLEDFTKTYELNVGGVLFTIGAFLELLDAGNKNALKGGFGAPSKPDSQVPSVMSSVVITASVASFSRSRFSAPAYGASKAAVMWLMKSASTNLAGYGIRVNALAPGCK